MVGPFTLVGSGLDGTYRKRQRAGTSFDFIVEGNKVVRKCERKRGEYRLLPLRYF